MSVITGKGFDPSISSTDGAGYAAKKIKLKMEK